MNPLLAFYIGILVQAIFLLGYNFEKKDVWKFLGCIGFGICGMMAGKNEHVYDTFIHLFIFTLFFAGSYSFVFKEKLLQGINKDVLLVWNMILAYILLKNFLPYTFILIIFGILSLPTIVNVFYTLDRRYIWRVFFYVWFLFILVFITSSHTTFTNLTFFFERGAGLSTDPTKMFFLGASILYLITNTLYILELVPLPGKHQSMASRIYEVKKDMEILATQYQLLDQKMQESLFVILVAGILLMLNYFYRFFSDSSLIYLLIAITPVVDRFLFKKKDNPGIEPIEPKVIIDPDTQIETILQ